MTKPPTSDAAGAVLPEDDACCDCGAVHDDLELGSNHCACCGKPIE